MQAGILESLKGWKKKAWSRWRQSAVILMYHRVAATNGDPQLLCVSPENFREHLEIIASQYHRCDLEQLAGSLQHNRLGARSVAVTFDDGYADNLHNAKPLLKTYDVPATVFVTSGLVDQDKEFWWDHLERLLLLPGDLPEIFEISIKGKDWKWGLHPAERLTEADYRRHLNWHVLEKDDPTPRHSLYRKLHALLRPLPEEARRHLLNQFLQYSSLGAQARLSHRILTAAELRELAQGALVRIGAHTVTHSVLARLSLKEQRAEIRQSKARLEEITGYPVTTFSYPYGSPGDYAPETVAEVSAAKFSCACANFAGRVTRSSSRWELPRFLVRNWPGDVFERFLAGCFHE